MSQLDKDLEAGVALWLVHGDARPLVDRAVARICAHALDGLVMPEFNHSVYRASEPGAVEAVRTARTLPMMADRRLVVVHDLQEADDELLGAVVEYGAQPSEGTVFVLTGAGFPKVRKGGKNWSARVQNAFKKHGRVIKLQSGAVPTRRFAEEHAGRLGKRLEPRGAELLVELVGDDLGRIEQEVEKVALFAGDAPTIDADAVLAACSMVAASVVWDLTAAIASRDPDLALASLHRQLEEGEDPRKILGMVAWQLRQLLLATNRIRRGQPPGVRLRPQQLREVERAVKEGRGLRAAEVMGRVASANRQMNAHRAGDRRIIERLILDLCVG